MEIPFGAGGESALEQGALGLMAEPVTTEQVDEALERAEYFLSRPTRRLLVVEDDDDARTRSESGSGHGFTSSGLRSGEHGARV